MNNKINVLLCKVGEVADVVEIDDTLEAMQNVVGGNIEIYMPFKDEVAIVCNEEGKLRGLELNRSVKTDEGEIIDIICGDFFIAYAPVESENFMSMPEVLFKKYEREFRFPEVFFKGEMGLVTVPHNPKKKGEIEHDR